MGSYFINMIGASHSALAFKLLGLLTLLTVFATTSSILINPVNLKGKGYVCNLPPSPPGMCFAYLPMWTFNKSERRCFEFIYGGCGGNENRFWSREECERTCL